jgi:hypothetical protein
MRSLILSTMAALLFPISSLAASEQEAPAAKEKLICKEFPRIGSRLSPRRYCLTRNEWDLVAFESRRVLGEFVQRSTTAAPATSAGTPK